MERKTGNDLLHIVMVPWAAFGHMIPFYELGKALAKKGVKVSYISTPKNIERLPNIPSEISSLMIYVSLPLPTVPVGLRHGEEATVDMENDQLPYLEAAYDLLHEPIKKFVLSQSHAPDWLISDVSGHMIFQVAKECRAKLMYFYTFNATMLCFVGPPEYLTPGEDQIKVRGEADSLTVPPLWTAGWDWPPSVALRSYEAADLHNAVYSKRASGTSLGWRLAMMRKGCDAICVRSCREFEGMYFDLYQTLVNKPVIPVGLLPPPKLVDNLNNAEGRTWINSHNEAFKWLDQQSPKSVTYVSFGSEYKLTKDQVYEVAYGLELAQIPFIWAFKKPKWAVDESEALPPGFAKRTSGKGMVCHGWAPQLEILAHSSVGGFLTHCGWGSTVEGLQHGHVLIMLPFIIDQGLNARMLVDKGWGVEVERKEDGSFTRDDIASALRHAMLGDEAQKIKARAMQAATIFGDHKLHEEQYIAAFVEFLRIGS